MKNKVSENKGKMGHHVGAPQKNVVFPKPAFTMAALFERNDKNVCALTCRVRLKEKVKNGEILRLEDRKQPGGNVGRPLEVYVLAENFNKDKHVLYVKGSAPVPTTTDVVEVVAAVPAAPPVVENPAPVEAAPQADVLEVDGGIKYVAPKLD